VTAQYLESLPAAAVAGGAVWLLHKRAGLPVGQALAAVLLSLILGPAAMSSQASAFVPQVTRAAAAITSRLHAPRLRGWRTWTAAARAVLTVACCAPGAAAGVIAGLAGPAVPAPARFACGAPPADRRTPPRQSVNESE
jgi:hypothetical protein